MLTLKEQTMLGNIPSDWNRKTLLTLLSTHYPGDWGEDRGPHMTKVLRSTNLTNNGHLDLEDIALRALPTRKVELLSPKKFDILLERSGGGPGQPVGRVGFVEADMPGCAFSNFLHLLRPSTEEIDPRYLGWVLHRINQTGRIVRLEQQTTQMRNLNFRDYLRMPLPLPLPEEQTPIAQILDAVDTLLQRTRTVVDRARRARQALAQRLFSEGVRGERQKKSAIGPVPQSWEVLPTSAVVPTFQYGLSVPMQTDGSLPILRMGNIQDGDVQLGDLKYVSLPSRFIKPYLLQRGDVLFNRTNSQEWVGKVGIYRHDRECVFASYLIRLLPDPTKIDGYFLGHVLNSYQAQCRIKRYATPGVQQVNINATNLGKVLIPVPSGPNGLEQQRKIAAMLEAAKSVVQCYQPVLDAQYALKKSLMYDLLTGRVRAKSNVEAIAK